MACKTPTRQERWAAFGMRGQENQQFGTVAIGAGCLTTNRLSVLPVRGLESGDRMPVKGH